MNDINIPIKGINSCNLIDMAKRYPQYTKIFSSLFQIDKFIKDVLATIINNQASNPSAYSVKTEFNSNVYYLYLYNSELKSTMCTLWTIDDLLDKCRNKVIEFEINIKVMDMLSEFNSLNKDDGSITKWI